MVDPMNWSQAWNNMFPLQVPLVEKLVRPVIVYLVLVVLLSLSNTVQNAIIGNDNTVTGGLVGAFALLAVNWVVARMLFRSRKLTHALEGRATVLVRNGKLDHAALRQESLTVEDLTSVLHRQGFSSIDQVALCQLEPNGTFYAEADVPTANQRQHEELMKKIDALGEEIRALRSGKTAADGAKG